MGGCYASMKIRVALLMTLLSCRRLIPLLLLSALLLLYLQQDLVEMLLLDIFGEIREDPWVNQCLEWSQSGLRVYQQDLLKEAA